MENCDTSDAMVWEPIDENLHPAHPSADVDDIQGDLKPCFIQRLPQELLDAIVHCLREDKQSLANCTLVLPQWLRRARKHLFRLVHIGYKHSIRDFFCFLQIASPHITSAIYRVTLEFKHPHDLGIDLPAIARGVSQMPSLSELWLRDISRVVFPQSFSILELRVTAPEVLVLEEGSVSAPELATLLTLFPNLAELYVEGRCDISSASVKNLSKDTPQALSGTEKLTKLAIGGKVGHAAVLDVVRFTSAAQFPIITEVELNFLECWWLPTAKEILRECGAHLKELAIDLSSFYHSAADSSCPLSSLGLSACKKLQRLRLDLNEASNSSSTWIQSILSDILRHQPDLGLRVDLAFDRSGDIPTVSAWDDVLSTYSTTAVSSFRFWCRIKSRWTDSSNAFFRGRLLHTEEQEQVRKLLPKTGRAGTLKFI